MSEKSWALLLAEENHRRGWRGVCIGRTEGEKSRVVNCGDHKTVLLNEDDWTSFWLLVSEP